MKSVYFFLILYFLVFPSFIRNQLIRGQEDKNINIKVEPSKYNKLTLDDLDQVKMEILHDMNQHIKNIEDQMIDNQRLTDKTMNSWSKTGAPIFIPTHPGYPEYSIPTTRDVILGSDVNKPIVMYATDNDEKETSRFKQKDDDDEEEDLELKLKEANEAIQQLKKITNLSEMDDGMKTLKQAINEQRKIEKEIFDKKEEKKDEQAKTEKKQLVKNQNLIVKEKKKETENKPSFLKLVDQDVIPIKNIDYNPFSPTNQSQQKINDNPKIIQTNLKKLDKQNFPKTEQYLPPKSQEKNENKMKKLLNRNGPIQIKKLF